MHSVLGAYTQCSLTVKRFLSCTDCVFGVSLCCSRADTLRVAAALQVESAGECPSTWQQLRLQNKNCTQLVGEESLISFNVVFNFSCSLYAVLNYLYRHISHCHRSAHCTVLQALRTPKREEQHRAGDEPAAVQATLYDPHVNRLIGARVLACPHVFLIFLFSCDARWQTVSTNRFYLNGSRSVSGV